MKKGRPFFFALTISNIGIILLGVLINLAGRYGSVMLSLPVRLDIIGTALVSAVAGPFAGALTGGVSSSLECYFIGIFVPGYVIVSIATGMAIGFFYPKDWTNSVQAMSIAVLCSVISIICTFLSFQLDGQTATGNIWGDAMYTMLVQNGNTQQLSDVIAIGFVDIPDRILTMLVIYWGLRESGRLKAFLQGRKYLGRETD